MPRLYRREFLMIWGQLALVAACGPAAPSTPAGKPTEAPSAPSAPASKPTEATAKPAGDAPKAAAPAQGAAGKNLTLTSNEPITFDPALGNGASSLRVTLNAYQGLLGFKYGTLDLEPVLATDYSISDDKKSWTFKLRPNVKFHDGTDLDADAVKYSFDRMKKIDQGLAFLLAQYDSSEAIDKGTVKVNLKSPVATFAMMLPKILIVSPTAAKQNEKNGDLGQAWLAENTAGTGPYKSESWERGVQNTLVKFDGYWGGWNGQHVDRVTNRVVKEVPTQRMMVERGDADISNTYNIDDFDALKNNKDLVIASDPSTTTLDFVMATHRGPMKDVRVRQALRYMFPYDAYLSSVMKGYAKPQRGPWSSKLPFSDDSWQAPKQDLAKAKELLTQAGFGNAGLKLSISSSGTIVERNQAAQLLQAAAKSLGVEMTFEAMPVGPWYAMLENPETSSDLFILGSFPSYPDPDAVVYQLYHSSASRKGGYNFGYYNNPNADKLMDQGRTTLDEKQRADVYKQLAKQLDDDATSIHVMEQDYITLNRAWVKGYKFAPAYYQVYFYYQLYLDGKP